MGGAAAGPVAPDADSAAGAAMSSSHRSVQAAAPAPARVGRASTQSPSGLVTAAATPTSAKAAIPRSPTHRRRAARIPRPAAPNISSTSVPMISATLSVVPNTLMAQSFTDDGTRSTTTSPTDTTGLSVPSIKALTSSATPSATAAASTPAHAARPLSVRRVTLVADADAWSVTTMPGRAFPRWRARWRGRRTGRPATAGRSDRRPRASSRAGPGRPRARRQRRTANRPPSTTHGTGGAALRATERVDLFELGKEVSSPEEPTWF